MNICIMVYDFARDKVYAKHAFPITRETEKCYWCKTGLNEMRILKSELGTVKHLSTKLYPYLLVEMIDTAEEELRNKIAEWFENKANMIKKGVI